MITVRRIVLGLVLVSAPAASAQVTSPSPGAAPPSTDAPSAPAAQGSAPASGTASPFAAEQSQEAFAFYDRGKRNFESEDFVAAAVEFDQAWRLFAALARDESGAMSDPKLRPWALTALSQSATAFSRAQLSVEAFDAFKALKDQFWSELDAGRREEVDAALARLKERIGTVTLDGLPAGAEIRIDGRLLRDVELSGPIRVSAGQRALEVRAPFYKPFTTTFTVNGLQHATVSVQMENSTLPTQLRLESNVDKAQVEIDGKPQGNVPLEVVIEPGSHTYKVTSESYSEKEGKFDALPGQRTVVSVGLVPHHAPLGLRIEAGYVSAWPLRGGTPFNSDATAENPVPEGVQGASGAQIRTYFSFERVRNIRLALGVEALSRPLNPASIGLGALWCPDATTFNDGNSGWCPIQLEPRVNLGGSPVGPFTSGKYSLRLASRLETRFFERVAMSFSAGVSSEEYRRNNIIPLNVMTGFIAFAAGLDL